MEAISKSKEHGSANGKVAMAVLLSSKIIARRNL